MIQSKRNRNSTFTEHIESGMLKLRKVFTVEAKESLTSLEQANALKSGGRRCIKKDFGKKVDVRTFIRRTRTC